MVVLNNSLLINVYSINWRKLDPPISQSHKISFFNSLRLLLAVWRLHQVVVKVMIKGNYLKHCVHNKVSTHLSEVLYGKKGWN